MPKIKTVVGSEYPSILQEIVELLSDHNDIEIVKVFDQYEEGKVFLLSQPWELLILYVPQPSLDCKGSEINHLIVKNSILITDTPDFALVNYELGGLDYIVRPFTKERLNIGIEKIKYYLFDLNKTTPIERMKTLFCEIKDGKDFHRISLAEILYIQGFGPYLKIFLVNGTCLISYMTFKQLFEKLNCDLFIQCHRSYVINSVYVKNNNTTSIQLINQIEIPIGKQYKLSKI